jgi:hypothetical protein
MDVGRLIRLPGHQRRTCATVGDRDILDLQVMCSVCRGRRCTSRWLLLCIHSALSRTHVYGIMHTRSRDREVVNACMHTGARPGVPHPHRRLTRGQCLCLCVRARSPSSDPPTDEGKESPKVQTVPLGALRAPHISQPSATFAVCAAVVGSMLLWRA